jgi:hypothetical protein
MNIYLSNTRRIVPFEPEPAVMLEYDPRTWNYRFPSEKGVNKKKLRLTEVGVYSIATPAISRELAKVVGQVTKYIKKTPSNVIITETSGGVGGFTIQLAKTFKHINVVELLPEHARIIKHNLQVYKRDMKDIRVINSGYLEVMYDWPSDIIISDPPWGGSGYKTKKYINLGYDNLDIISIINRLHAKHMFKAFILFAPKNYDMASLDKLVPTEHVVVPSGKHYIIIIFSNDIAQ